MKRILRYFWLPTLVAASACAFRPNMGAAMSSEHLAKQPVGGDLGAEIAAAYREIEDLGYEVIRKTYALDRATTLHQHILLPVDFDSRPKAAQLQMLRHELVHARQWRALGLVVFGAKYGNESTRWVLEMHGYRQQVRDMCSAKVPHEEIGAWVAKRAESFPKSYLFTPKHHAKVTEATAAVLTAEMDFCDGSPD